jgi:Holliday junction DNA helicase RuvA
VIAQLTGKLTHKSPEFIILDVHGVGYRVQIPFSTYYELPDTGSETSLSIYTHVKEDAIHLYGFRTPVEKSFFQLLLSVSGIGPKLAKDILSNIQVDELAQSIQRGDLARLSAVPGIGRKTAERMVLELKEKVLKLSVTVSPKEESRPATSSPLRDDVASALVNLGYKEAVVKKVLGDLAITSDMTMEEVLKQALKLLMK